MAPVSRHVETSSSRSLFSTCTLQESYNHPLGSVSHSPGVEAWKQSQTACYHARHISLVLLRCGKTRLALDRKIRLPLGTVLKFGSKKHFVGRVVGADAMVVLVVLPVLGWWLCCWGWCSGCAGRIAGAGAVVVLLGLVQWLCWLCCRYWSNGCIAGAVVMVVVVC
jgi:hypothetical protein